MSGPPPVIAAIGRSWSAERRVRGPIPDGDHRVEMGAEIGPNITIRTPSPDTVVSEFCKQLQAGIGRG